LPRGIKMVENNKIKKLLLWNLYKVAKSGVNTDEVKLGSNATFCSIAISFLLTLQYEKIISPVLLLNGNFQFFCPG